jgi:hypothetical protein
MADLHNVHQLSERLESQVEQFCSLGMQHTKFDHLITQ